MIHEAYLAPVQLTPDTEPLPRYCATCRHDRAEPRCHAEDLGLTPGWRRGGGLQRLLATEGVVRCPRWEAKPDGA